MEKRTRTIGQLIAAAAIVAIAPLAGGCGRGAHADTNGPVDSRPKVTVASPVAATVTEFSEQTGRAEAPGTVDIRARVAGHIVRAPFKEGDLVKKGDLLFSIDPRPYQVAVARAKAELESSHADHSLATRNTARAEALFKSNVIAEAERDKESSVLAQLAARTDVAAAALSSAQLDLEYATVRSPIDGRIGRALVTPGNLVGPQSPSPLATVVSVNPLYVYVDVDEAHGLALAKAAHPVAHVGFAGEEGNTHDAPITFVDNRVDPATGTIKIRAVVDNADGRLRDGLFARVRLPETDAHEAILVSDRAIATDQDRRFVWVVGADGKVQYRSVKLGPLESGLRVVREGLAASDRIVVRGLQRVGPGVEVNVETIAMRAVDGDGARHAMTEGKAK